MPESRFLLYRSYGKRQDVLSRVKNYVQENNLGIDIPLIKFEPGRTKEFYYGLAIQTYGDENVLDNPKIVLLKNSLVGTFFPNTNSKDRLFGAEEIKKFLAGNVDWEGFNAKIQYEVQHTDYDPNVVQEEYTDTSSQPVYSFENDPRYNQLFLYLSGRKKGSFVEFSRIIKLFFDEPNNKPWPIMRRLLLLGHIEIDAIKDKNWSIMPFSLTKMETNQNMAYISGQMLPEYFEKIKVHEGIQLSEQQNYNTPSTQYVTVNDEGVFDEIKSDLSINVLSRSGISLLELLPSISNIEKYLDGNEHFNLVEYKVYSLDDKPIELSNLNDGAYIVKHESTPYYGETTLKKGDTWLFGSYYDVLFFDKVSNVNNLPSCVYLEKEERLLIPDVLRPPFLFEKALIQCSGVIPGIEQFSNAKYLNYPNISKKFVEMYADKTTINIEWR